MDCVASTAKFQFANAPPAGVPTAPLLLVAAALAAEAVLLALAKFGGYDLGFLVYMLAVNWVSL